MPELPEVETNARNLAAWTRGRRVVDVTPPSGTRETGGIPPAEVVARLRGRRVEEVRRLGKWIVCRLSGGGGLAIHLGMTGKLAVVGEREAPPRFTRAVLRLDDGAQVCFVDMRRFGKFLAATRVEELLERDQIAQIGLDALGELTVGALRAALGRTARSVKEAIMDQRVAAGVGNLYATEALWRAGIHPARPARDVAADGDAARALLAGIRAALRHGLGVYQEGAVPAYVEEGARNPFFAYDRAGEPCRRCGSRLAAIVLGGRTTVFCPRCQPPRRRAASS